MHLCYSLSWYWGRKFLKYLSSVYVKSLLVQLKKVDCRGFPGTMNYAVNLTLKDWEYASKRDGTSVANYSYGSKIIPGF